MSNKNAPWMLAAGEMKKDALFFVPVGIICGIIQIISHRYFQSDWGGDLLQEHIPFYSLLMMIVFLWLSKGLMEWLSARKEIVSTRKLIKHVSRRATALASFPASVLIGFAIAAASDGAFYYSYAFLLLSLYFVALAEIASNPLMGANHSRTYLPAMIIIVVMPFGARLLA